MFALDIARDQRIFELHRDRAGHAPFVRDRGGLHRQPGRHVRQPVIADLARPDEITQRLDDFLDRRDPVPDVHPVEIDIIGAEPLQRRIERPVDILGARSAGMRIAAAARTRAQRAGGVVEPELGGQHDGIARPRFGDEPADPRFAFAVAIDIGRIDEIAARRTIGVKDAARCGLVCAPPPGAERHRAQRQRADDKAGSAECAKVGQRHAQAFIAFDM